MASDVMIDEEQLTKHLKAFWDNILFCKIPSHQLLPDFVLEQLCRLACNSWTREHFKNSLSSSIDDSISSLEDHSLSSMEKLEKIGIFFYRNCSGAETLILDKFQSFMERNSSEKFPLKLRILELFCKLNDNAYDDFVAKQIVLFTSNTSISENKQLNGLLLSCIEHYISWTEINRSSFICCKLIPHCSSDLFNLVFVSVRVDLLT